MRTVPALLVLLAVLPSATALGVLPPEPPSRTAPGLSTVVFRLPVRYDASQLEVSAAGDPVGAAGLARPGGTPDDWTPLSADPTLDLPPPNASCWHGYCGMAHVVVRLLAPSHEGSTRVPILLEADGTRVGVPLRLTTDARRPRAEVGSQAVHVETPHARTLEAVHLRSPEGNWTARPDGGAFTVPRDRLPAGTPVRPVLVLRNGTTVAGLPVQVPADSPTGSSPGGPGPDDAGNRSSANRTAGPADPDATPADGSAAVEPGAGGPGPPPDPPPAPARADGTRTLPGPSLLVVAALAAAARATL